MKKILTDQTLMRSMFIRSLLFAVPFYGLIFTATSQTLKVWPGTSKGSGITYGADVKLTLWRITDHDAVNQKFADMGFDQVRVPIVAHWGTTDSRYDDVKDFVNSAKSKGLNVFASVANADGTFKANGDLNDAHNDHKFANWLKCTSVGGTQNCTDSEEGIYGLKLSRYKDYIEDVVDNSIGNVSWVGAFNEDPADAADYSGTDFGKSSVGVESWGLSGAATALSNVESSIDIGGAHNYASNNAVPDLDAAYDEWENFVDEGGRWFTESTLFAKSTAHGIAHMLPAISAGIEKIVIYQAVARLVTTSGGEATHYAAANHLMKNSKGKGSAKRMETNNSDYVGAAFVNGGKLILHLCNINSSQKTMWVNLQEGYTVTSVAGKTTYGGSSTVTIKNNGAQVEVTLPAESYARVSLDGISNSARVTVEEGVPYTKEDADTENSPEFATDSDFLVYPNPASEGKLHILLPSTINQDQPFKVSILDLSGRSIKEEIFSNSKEINFDSGSINSGNYLLSIEQNDFKQTKRITID